MTTAVPHQESSSRSLPSSRKGPSVNEDGQRLPHSPALAKLDQFAEQVKEECGEIDFPMPRTYVDGSESRPVAPTSVRILATLAIATVVVLAAPILLPITIALLLALTLRPIVRRLRRHGIPYAVSAAALLAALVVLGIAGVTSVVEPARHWAQSAPEQLKKINGKLSDVRQQWAVISDTSEKVKELTETATGEEAEEVVTVEMREPPLSQNLTIATSTGNAVGHCLVVLVLSFFVLTSGDHLLNQILAGLPRLSEKKRTVELVREVERGIATYLSTVTMINAGLGIATGVGFWLLGVPNPALWGVMAFLFNYVPFFGPLVCTVIIIFVSLLSFESLAYACIPPLYFIAISAVEGNVLTPMIVGKSMSLNPIIVFLALVVGGWAWGLGGAILAVPLLAVTKIASDKFECTQPLSRLLSG